MKNNISVILLLMVCYIATTNAQDVDTTSRQPVNQTVKTTNASSSQSKWPWKKKKQQVVDSLPIYKDSVAVLNDSIKNLIISLQTLKEGYADFETKNKQLNQQLKSQKEAINKQIVTNFGQHLKDAPAFFCRAVMESSLFYKYNSEDVNYCLELSKSMEYDNPDYTKNYIIYGIYIDLLRNYSIYYQELIDELNTIISQFSRKRVDREFERRQFEDWLTMSQYYKIRGKGDHSQLRHIFYLDFQIERIRKLFENDADFKKTSFEEIRDGLL